MTKCHCGNEIIQDINYHIRLECNICQPMLALKDVSERFQTKERFDRWQKYLEEYESNVISIDDDVTMGLFNRGDE